MSARSPACCHSSTSRAAAAVNRPGARSDRPRSCPAELIAIRQPSPGSPMTSASGTNTSSRKISANPASPSSCAIGRTVTPSRPQVEHEIGQAAVPLRAADRTGTARRPGPRTPRASSRSSGPTAASRRRYAAPATGSRPGRCRPRVLTRPAPRPRRPAPSRGRTRSRCSSLPCANRVGASTKSPFWPTRTGPPARRGTPPRRPAIPAATRPGRRRRPARTPRPAARRRASPPTAGAARSPRRCRPRAAAAAGTCSASQPATSARNSCRSGSKSRFTRPPASSTWRSSRPANRRRSRRCERARHGAGRTSSPSRCACPSGPRTG